ncbi:RusA family crossover junction endodeoxyribonuclease [Corynebacterium heidelbergense]|uniref:RusA family crossover junction endodeoxyribonuclease n=1 Tax=Corynebacterium heidelbergense TaxID=2055947 RepID=A0A364VE29_9CORY|nr:RusA family crossover junction endodeoxyribonuclease [Corynebacterium heidelbergense]RAV34905.1 RusA family crossover junction endodeoxyribonuclease [Corynebacterium heidelbergense]WCZ36041.1 Endodeoxyribonuclease RusA [Corynebacterium heidelbergense]
MTLTEMKVFVPGVPAPQGSKSGFVRGGRCVLVESSKKVSPWRAAVARAFTGEPATGPLRLFVEFVMPRPKNLGDKTAPPMDVRPDLDKLLRSTCDGMTGAAYADDSQVVHIIAHKRRARPGETTGAHIRLTPATSGGSSS